MSEKIKKIIGFQLSGKFAHFRKFYTNSSSLTYSIPPRTVICGLLASILKIPRDEYYKLFSSDNLKISIVLTEDTNFRKIAQSINYLHDRYYNLLIGKSGKVLHSQCKFELLTSREKLKYNIYLGIVNNKQEFNQLEEKLKNRNFGYGIYLGQRQFLADIDNVTIYESETFKYFDVFNKIDSVCVDDSIKELDFVNSTGVIQKEKMPSDFVKVEDGREIQDVKNVIYEQSGKRLTGQFKDIYEVHNKYLHFY